MRDVAVCGFDRDESGSADNGGEMTTTQTTIIRLENVPAELRDQIKMEALRRRMTMRELILVTMAKEVKGK